MDYYRSPESIEAAAAARMCLSRLAALVQDSVANAEVQSEGAAVEDATPRSQPVPQSPQPSGASPPQERVSQQVSSPLMLSVLQPEPSAKNQASCC